MLWISTKYFLTVTLSRIGLFNLLFKRFLTVSAGSMPCVYLCAAFEYNGALISVDELISS